MELITVKIFTDQDESIYSKDFNGSNPLENSEVVQQDFLTGSVKDHIAMNRDLIYELPSNICGDKTIVNKLLTRKRLEIDVIDSSFFDDGYFDYDRTTKYLRKYLSDFYYKVLAINIIMEFKSYLVNKDRVLFELTDNDVPDYVDMESLKSLISFLLRSRGINVIQTEDDDKVYLLIENVNSSAPMYLSKILSKHNPIDIDMYRIHVSEITSILTTTQYKIMLYEFIKDRDEVKLITEGIPHICEEINSEEYTYDVLGRLKQLYGVLKFELELLLKFNGVFNGEDLYTPNTTFATNQLLELYNSCINNSIHVENYRLIVEVFTDVLIDTDKFKVVADIKSENILNVCSNITQGVSNLYSDIVKLYLDGSNVCICCPKRGEFLW